MNNDGIDSMTDGIVLPATRAVNIFPRGNKYCLSFGSELLMRGVLDQAQIQIADDKQIDGKHLYLAPLTHDWNLKTYGAPADHAWLEKIWWGDMSDFTG